MSLPDEGGRPPAGPGRREQAVELAVFLFLIVPSMALSFLAVRQGGLGFDLLAGATILRDLSLVVLVLFFLWRNGESFRAIGWRAEHVWQEVLVGLVLFAPLFAGASWLDGLLHAAGLSAPSTPLPSLTPTRSIGELALAVVLVAVVAFAEETLFRGYLILRLESVTGSPAAAVLLSAVVFSLGHGYEGSAGVLTVGAMGALFAVVYLWRRSLVAPIVMHLLQDLLSIVILPAIASH
jgi:membrane protease YdiL (CAAX protease family)